MDAAVCCTNALLTLDQVNLKDIIEEMQQRVKDKYNALILLWRQPVQLIVSSDNESLAKKNV